MLLVLALMGFATFIISYIGLATIRSADALARYDLSEQHVAQASIEGASRRIHFLDQTWTPVRWLGLSTTIFSLLSFGLTFKCVRNIKPNDRTAPSPATASGVKIECHRRGVGDPER